MKNKKYISGVMALAIIGTLATAVPAFAENNIGLNLSTNISTGTRPALNGHLGVGVGRTMMKPGVFGTVSAVSGTIITVTSTHRVMSPKNTNGTTPSTSSGQATTTAPVTTTYTVDATSATITKNNVAGNVLNIVVGDTIMAQGTLTGTNLVATTIRDSVMTRTPGVAGTGTNAGKNQPSPITGNGQPVVAGTVSSVSGNTLTITNKSNVTYTVDTTNAKIVEGQTTITVSNIVIGDSAVVQGTINGNTVTASSVIDQKANTGSTTQPKKGFFGSIGSFFSHIFGF